MKNTHRIVYLLLLIPLSSYATEKHDILEQAKKYFGTKVEYKELEVSFGSSAITASDVTRYYAASKTGNTLFVYGEKRNEDYCIISRIKLESFEQLKEYEEFKKFAFSFWVPLKICTKKYNITMPKYLRHILLKNGFTHYPFDHNRFLFKGGLKKIRCFFPQYKKIETIFVDDNGTTAINFKDEHSNNILWAFKILDSREHISECCIVPAQAPIEGSLIHKDLCTPGIIQKVSIKERIKIDPNSSLECATSTLVVKKDNKKYILDLPH